VDGTGRARLADFGLAVVTQSLDSVQSVDVQRGHTARWTAPEVLDEKPYSKETDIFSFAMVMIEVRHGRYTTCQTSVDRRFVSMQAFTGAIPFSGGSPLAAITHITQGRRPPRPTHSTFTEDLWGLMQRCWDHDPHLRPEVSEVLQVLIRSVFLSITVITLSPA